MYNWGWVSLNKTSSGFSLNNKVYIANNVWYLLQINQKQAGQLATLSLYRATEMEQPLAGVPTAVSSHGYQLYSLTQMLLKQNQFVCKY